MDWIIDFLNLKEQILHFTQNFNVKAASKNSLESMFYQLTRSNHLNPQFLSSPTVNTELKLWQTFQETPQTQKLQIRAMKDQLDLQDHQMANWLKLLMTTGMLKPTTLKLKIIFRKRISQWSIWSKTALKPLIIIQERKFKPLRLNLEDKLKFSGIIQTNLRF